MHTISTKLAKLIDFFRLSHPSDFEKFREEFEETHPQLKFERHQGAIEYRDPATEEQWLKWSRQRFWDDAQW